MSRIVGIDLGTTNSLVAYVDEETGLPRVIPDREGRVLLPSVVSFTTEGVVVGEAAKRLLVRRPATTVYSVKRLMGRGHEDVKEELCYLPFKVVPCDGIVKIQVEDREVTPPQVSASPPGLPPGSSRDRKSTRLNSSHVRISYAVFCLKKTKTIDH